MFADGAWCDAVETWQAGLGNKLAVSAAKLKADGHCDQLACRGKDSLQGSSLLQYVQVKSCGSRHHSNHQWQRSVFNFSLRLVLPATEAGTIMQVAYLPAQMSAGPTTSAACFSLAVHRDAVDPVGRQQSVPLGDNAKMGKSIASVHSCMTCSFMLGSMHSRFSSSCPNLLNS